MNNISIMSELKQIASNIIKANELKYIEIQFKHVQRGSARYNTRKITIPLFAIDKTRAYAIYYVIHELTHFIVADKRFGWGHGKIFQEIEKTILEKYNMRPVYAKAYPKYLTDLYGVKLCGKYGEELKGIENVI